MQKWELKAMVVEQHFVIYRDSHDRPLILNTIIELDAH